MAKKTQSSTSSSRERSGVERPASEVVNPDAPSVDTTPERETRSDSSGSRERIAARAYELYLKRGGAHGRETEDWLEAERELSGSSHGAGSSSDPSDPSGSSSDR